MAWSRRSEWDVRQDVAELRREMERRMDEMSDKQQHQHNDLHDMGRGLQGQFSQMFQAQENHQAAMMEAHRKDSEDRHRDSRTLLITLFVTALVGFVGVVLSVVLSAVLPAVLQ